MHATIDRPQTQRQPRSKPARTVRVLEQPTAYTDFWGAIEIAVGKQAAAYLIHAIPGGYEVEKLDAQLVAVESYVVTLDETSTSCTCKGHERHRHCKHLDGLLALRRAGRIS